VERFAGDFFAVVVLRLVGLAFVERFAVVFLAAAISFGS
jgi:hypothetical protein